MQIVIDISEYEYEKVKELVSDGVFDYEGVTSHLYKAVCNGTPTRKKGRWIRKPIRNNKGGCVSAKMICTYCGKDNELDKKLNFCPNCGAGMESEK